MSLGQCMSVPYRWCLAMSTVSHSVLRPNPSGPLRIRPQLRCGSLVRELADKGERICGPVRWTGPSARSRAVDARLAGGVKLKLRGVGGRRSTGNTAGMILDIYHDTSDFVGIHVSELVHGMHLTSAPHVMHPDLRHH